MDFEKLLTSRSATDYAAFFLPHLRNNMKLLDCGCGPGSITCGLAERFSQSAVVGLDFASEFQDARAYADKAEHGNVSFIQGDANTLPFPDYSFDAVFAHSIIETLSEPVGALTEMRRVMKDGGVIGAASVEYAGALISGPNEELLKRFYSLREQQWKLGDHAEPRRGAQLRRLLSDAGFRDVRASARYISYGDPAAVHRLGEDRARQCEVGEYAEEVVTFDLSSTGELQEMAKAWRIWSDSPDAFFAFRGATLPGGNRVAEH